MIGCQLFSVLTVLLWANFTSVLYLYIYFEPRDSGKFCFVIDL
jgi:hypothetical protein